MSDRLASVVESDVGVGDVGEVDVDVVVVGGGPAGATAAALFANAGHSVRVLERERFPRFHIGESLLPCELPVFARLGLTPEAHGHLVKRGAEFLHERTGRHTIYPFREGLGGDALGFAYQVDRSAFDSMLLTRASEVGADVREGVRVQAFEVDGAGVRVQATDGEHRARFVVDATGQDAFTGRRDHTIEPMRGFGLAAVFQHFHRLSPEARTELEANGNIRVLILDDGWAWAIPLSGGTLSFGVVRRTQGLGAHHLDEVLDASPFLSRVTRGATRTPARMIANWSYRNRRTYGPRFAAIGDAACFLDPVFSSGVSLAMLGAERLVDVVSPALIHHREDDPALAQPASEAMQRAYDTFAALIHAFYHSNLVEHLFFCEEPDAEMRAGLISVLGGDVFRSDNRFQSALLGGRRRKRADAAYAQNSGRPGGEPDDLAKPTTSVSDPSPAPSAADAGAPSTDSGR